MTVDELTGKLAALFPFFFNDQHKAEERVKLYRDSLASLAGDRLAEAYRRTMASWKHREPPMPGHFAENIPAPTVVTRGEDVTRPREDDVTDSLMRNLVASSIGREIVAEGLANFLEAMVRNRQISEVGDLSRGLIDRLRKSRAEFEAANRKLDGNVPFADVLMSMSRKLQDRAARCNTKWAEFVRHLDTAA